MTAVSGTPIMDSIVGIMSDMKVGEARMAVLTVLVAHSTVKLSFSTMAVISGMASFGF